MDNGGAYARHNTRRIATSFGLMPINTPACSALLLQTDEIMQDSVQHETPLDPPNWQGGVLS